MIKKIILSNIATFKHPVEIDPKKINYIYGSNGSGKTTISRVLSNPKKYPSCIVDFNSEPEEIFVYNRDFVNENFKQEKLKGIFTLGKDVPETQIAIDEKTIEINRLRLMILGHKSTLEKLKDERQRTDSNYQDKCWEIKVKYQDLFREVLTGSIGSKTIFRDKCVAEQNNASELKELDYLVEKYNSLYKTELIPIEEVNSILVDQLKTLETSEIFSQAIVGKTESQIGKLIDFLGNSDWVSKGLEYLSKSERSVCPFCQKNIEESLLKEIKDFFDTSYKEDSIKLQNAAKTYIEYVEKRIVQLKDLLARDIPVFKFQRLPDLITAIEAEFQSNRAKINYKLESKSQKIKLSSLQPLFDEALLEINLCINKVQEYNKAISNIKNEKDMLVKQVWRFLAEETKPIISEFQKKIKGIEAGITTVNRKISELENNISVYEKIISELESSITSVTPSVNEINRILAGFNFQGFRLSEAEDKGYYKIIRDDGSEAKDSLSEGEFTFISFLYFYYLLKGSSEQSGITNDRIVVIDDPISSLDNNVLFIVSNLVKSLVVECLDKTKNSNIKQMFIMTHNVYFHKEVTFKGSRENFSNEEAFWIVRKTNCQSNIELTERNPINTSYELLWSEIRSAERINKVTVFNTLRRILEYYFKIIGGYDYETIINQFEFDERQTCKALISWINDGSHFVVDDLFIDTDLESIERYLSVFKDIFVKLGHESHYDMMMGKKCS